MTASPGNSYIPNQAAREAWEREIQDHRPYDMAELGELLSYADVIGTNKHQKDVSPDALLTQPVPEWLIHTNQEGATALCNNTEMYDDDTEDLIYEDMTMADLLGLKETDERARAIRARRTTIAFLIHHAIGESSADTAS